VINLSTGRQKRLKSEPLVFANEDFIVKFQVIDKLSINILLGMEFIRSNNCVPFANDGIFSLKNGRVCVPMQEGGND